MNPASPTGGGGRRARGYRWACVAVAALAGSCAADRAGAARQRPSTSGPPAASADDEAPHDSGVAGARAPGARASSVARRSVPTTTAGVTRAAGSPASGADAATLNARPWWSDLPAGLYARSTGTAVMAMGASSDHHHPAEGFLQAKVRARLAVRRAAGVVAFRGPMPEPYIEDLFIGPNRAFWALYRLDVPGNAALPGKVAAWTPPPYLLQPGRRRVGRHLFEDTQHLFLECDVEGPIANPDWGQSRASARP